MSGDQELGGAVRIGAQQIYDKLVEVETSVGRVDGKLDRHGDRLDRHEETLDDHEARLRSLERGRWPIPAASLLVALAAAVIAATGLFLGN